MKTDSGPHLKTNSQSPVVPLDQTMPELGLDQPLELERNHPSDTKTKLNKQIKIVF
jgi:hypothetical protein